MALSLSDLTSADAVQAALDEFTRLGQMAFLERHGFGNASGFMVRNPRTGTWADSKAIAGVALRYQYPQSGGLQASAFSGGRGTVVPRLTSLGFEVKPLADVRGVDWRAEEVALIVADYLARLTMELSGQSYSKAARRRDLLRRLPGRAAAWVEFLDANISAVLLELGFPYLRGHPPRFNFQRQLWVDEVAGQTSGHALLDQAAMSAVERPATDADRQDFHRVKVETPARRSVASEAATTYARPPIHRDYLEREARNRSLGLAGERFALSFERWRLSQLGAGDLADKVVHASLEEGDGLGYDIRSFEADGRPRFIEVKSTSFGERTPFFVSANELRFSREQAPKFHLYRLFDFRDRPRLFQLDGAIEAHCHLDATTFKASLG